MRWDLIDEAVASVCRGKSPADIKGMAQSEFYLMTDELELTSDEQSEAWAIFTDARDEIFG